MKKGLVVFNINLSDDFEIGQCEKCPMATIRETEVFPGKYEKKVGCRLRFDKPLCPIEIIKKENINYD